MDLWIGKEQFQVEKIFGPLAQAGRRPRRRSNSRTTASRSSLAGPRRAGRQPASGHFRSKRSRFITLVHAATKSRTKLSWASALP